MAPPHLVRRSTGTAAVLIDVSDYCKRFMRLMVGQHLFDCPKSTAGVRSLVDNCNVLGDGRATGCRQAKIEQAGPSSSPPKVLVSTAEMWLSHHSEMLSS